PYAAGLRFAVAEKEIPLDLIAVPVTKRERAFAVNEGVLAVNVFARLVRDDFDFPAALGEKIRRDDAAGVDHRGRTVADSNCFAAVEPELRPRTEMIMVDLVPYG